MSFNQLLSNQILPILTLMGLLTVLMLFIVSILPKSKLKKKVLTFFSKKAILFSFLVAFIATLGSLFYSEVLHYDPCKLCWYQRIFIYPQTVLLGLALFKKEKHIVDYSITIALIGGLISIYHYLLQIGVVTNAPCSAVGYSVSCSQRFVFAYGFITIPMMAITASAMILTFLLVWKKN